MRAVRIGTSPLRTFLVDNVTHVWPIQFTANDPAEGSVDNIYTQVELAASEGVRLFSVVLTMASFMRHGGDISVADRAMLRRVIALAPRAYVVLRVSFEGGATLGMEKNTIMSATNGSTMQCGCSWARRNGGANSSDDCASPTAAWAGAASVQLKRLLRAADATIPNTLVGVQVIGLSTGEWELPHDDFVYTNGTFDWFPAYSASMQSEWCAHRGEPAGCPVPSAAARNTPDVGNSFVTASASAAAVAYANFTARTVASTVATLCAAAKAASHGKLFTFAFFGYLVNSAVNVQFSGHAATAYLLSQPAVDAIASPLLYSATSRSPLGAVIPHGPWDSPPLLGKPAQS